jgi:hypothetical protein
LLLPDVPGVSLVTANGQPNNAESTGAALAP